MINIAEKVSDEFPFARVDLYSIEGEIYVGEITFCPAGGFGQFNDLKYDYELGDCLDLNKINKKYLGHWEKGFKFVYDRDANPGK